MSTLLQVVTVPQNINDEHLSKWVELFQFYWRIRFDNPQIILAESQNIRMIKEQEEKWNLNIGVFGE